MLEDIVKQKLINFLVKNIEYNHKELEHALFEERMILISKVETFLEVLAVVDEETYKEYEYILDY